MNSGCSRDHRCPRTGTFLAAGLALIGLPILGACSDLEPARDHHVMMSQTGASSSEYGNDLERHYRRDVQSVVEAALAAGYGTDELLRGVGRVAARYGISDWEDDPRTHAAISDGLEQAGCGASERQAILAACGSAGTMG